MSKRCDTNDDDDGEEKELTLSTFLLLFVDLTIHVNFGDATLVFLALFDSPCPCDGGVRYKTTGTDSQLV